MQNGFQNNQGFGGAMTAEELQKMEAQSQLAQQLAKLPNTDFGYDMLGAQQPEGQMVSGHFVPPSITQNASAAMQQAMGGQMVGRRGDMAAQLAKALAEMQMGKQGGAGGQGMGSMYTDPNEIDARYGQ